MKLGLVLAASLLALGACKGDAKKDAGAGTAQGEVLPGSTSDAMLPLDTVKSQAPLAPKSEGGEAGEVKGAKAGKAGAKPSAAVTDGAAITPEVSPSAADTPATN